MKETSCSRCSNEAKIPCPGCKDVQYCESSCQIEDWESHQFDCVPYTIHYEEKIGRMLIACRDIEAGEILFRDAPGAIGPDNNPKPCCLSCFKRMTGMYQHLCSKCNWPLCSSKCETGSMHERECSLFQIHRPKFNILDYRKECPSYNAIMALRALWLKENDLKQWKLIDKLMDHLESAEISTTKMEVVTFIRDHCKLIQFSEMEILHILGIIDTNAYIIGENPNRDIDIQGLFPITSILNHSCTGNTICFALDDYIFVCRATTDIKKGEELTTNYLHYHYHFFGTSYRRKDCASHWHFKCSCKRCLDPEEFGTGVDGIICEECAKTNESGILLPLSAKEPNSDWICNKCFSAKSYFSIQELLDEWWDSLDNTPKYNIPALERKHHELGQFFSDRHYYIMEVKRRLIDNLGETKGYELQDLPRPWLEKKIQYCKEHLQLQDRLAPGYSEYRAYISSHLGEALYYLTKKERKAGIITGHEAIERMEKIAEHLLTVINIWGQYRTRSSEKRIAENSKKLLESIDASYLHRNYISKLEEGLLFDYWKII